MYLQSQSQFVNTAQLHFGLALTAAENQMQLQNKYCSRFSSCRLVCVRDITTHKGENLLDGLKRGHGGGLHQS